MKTTRRYTMATRARAVDATRREVMQAVIDLSEGMPLADLTLDRVAAEAGVSVQTVLRHFGNRAGLMEATIAFGRETVRAEREAPVGDLPRAIAVLMAHYERRGDAVILLLAQERTDPTVREITDRGRAVHRRWVEEVFAPEIVGHADPDGLVDRLVVATDVYTWKLLRRDRGLSRARTEHQLLALCRAVLAGPDLPEDSHG